MEPSSRVRFGDFEANLRSGELRHHGLKVKLGDQSFQILALLLKDPGEVVTREQLQQKLWTEDTFVDFEAGLNSAIKRLRDALGDSADEPRFIETLPRRGYRFLLPVQVDGRPGPAELAAAPAPLPRAAWKKPAAAAAAVVILVVAAALGLNLGGLRDRLFGHAPEIHSLAVLPLENLSGDPEQEYFADGMTEALITNLGKTGELRVISRTSAMQYKGTRKTLPEIARELNVDAVVEGSVLRSGDRVRITAQLVEARSDRHLWAETYEREMRDVLTLQDQVAQAIAAQIRAKVTQPQMQRSRVRNVNPEAYEYYLKGRYNYAERSSKEGHNAAIRYFELAIEKDPGYAAAYAGMAHGYMSASFGGQDLPPREAWPKAAAAAKKALELDDQLGEAHIAMAVVHFRFDWNWPEAEREYRRGLELSPNDAFGHTSYAWFLGIMGRPDEAIAQLARARELDPFSVRVSNALAWVYAWSRRWDEAIAESGRTLQLDPNHIAAHNVLVWSYEAKGMYEEAVNEELKVHSLTGRSPEQIESLRRAFAASGIRGFWEKSLEWEKRERNRPRYFVLARLCVRLGRIDEAFHWLEKAYEARYPNMPNIKVAAAWLDPVRSDPRYADLLRRLNLPVSAPTQLTDGSPSQAIDTSKK
ncbi:MAG: winged helix-turn-helix domain-containing tetratricopeptide repeat protein [Candidatus Acidiferrales bacterium]